MTALERALRRIAGDLALHGKGFAVVGGLAVAVRAEPRFTRDVDLAVAVATDQEAESLVRQLLDRGYGLAAQVEHEGGRLATVRLRPPADVVADAPGLVVDLLFASSGIESEIVQRAQLLEIFPGLSVPVAATGHLLATKTLASESRRPQDQADIQALLGIATPADVEAARQALDAITQRGFSRGKDLRGEFETWLRKQEPAG